MVHWNNKDGRIRGRKLQDIRRRHFAMRPLCVACEKLGRVTIATQLDHINALSNGGEDADRNRQGLCDPCHAAKTIRDMGYQDRATFDRSGRVVW